MSLPRPPQTVSPVSRVCRSGSPGKRLFIPGTLPSLLSESLLSTQQVDTGNIDVANNGRSEPKPAIEAAVFLRVALLAKYRPSETSVATAPSAEVVTATQSIKKDPIPGLSTTEPSTSALGSQSTVITPKPKKATSKKYTKKRKSGGQDVYKPDMDSNDDTEPPTTIRKKKRPTVRTPQAVIKSSDPKSTNRENVNQARKQTITQAAIMSALAGSFVGDALADDNAISASSTAHNPLALSADYLPARSSIEGRTLKTVVEEAVTTSSVAIKGEPSKRTATKTPARPHLRVRSRSGSPEKSQNQVLPRQESLQILQRMTAEGAEVFAGERMRSRSPPPPSSDSIDLVIQEDDVVMVTPGRMDVPEMPELPEFVLHTKGGENGNGNANDGGVMNESANGEQEKVKEDWEGWPEDVF